MESLLLDFLSNTGYMMADYRNVIMMIIGSVFIYLGIAKHYEPLLLVPIGFGILMGNVPVFKGLGLSIYEDNSVLHYLYMGVKSGVYPPLIFMGIGALTDFSTMLARPVLMLLGAAAQMGVFITFLGALALGFPLNEAASIGIIGGADGLADTVKSQADLLWSLSPLTLPHGLARVMVAEQLYRAVSILHNHPYHRE